jgi:hypothetical protein
MVDEDAPGYHKPDKPAIEAKSSVYGWTNERDHSKVLIYVPAKIRRHKDFPLEKGEKVHVRIDPEEEVLKVSTVD